MRNIMISMALLFCVSAVMGQQDKATLKLMQKEAKAQMSEAKKIDADITDKINQKTASEQEIMTSCRKGQNLISKAIKSGMLDPDKLGEAYKISAELAMHPHNIMWAHAAQSQPFDTTYFCTNLRVLTDALNDEIKHTKITKGEAGNEKYIDGKKNNLAQCGEYYIFAAQFNSDINQHEKAVEAFETAINYEKIYPVVADRVKLRFPDETLAYYAFHAAHEGKLYDKMDAFYDMAMGYEEGAQVTKQVKMMSYLERGDTVAWAQNMRDVTLREPSKNADYIQILISYFLGQDAKNGEGSNLAINYIDEILAADPNITIAHYGKGHYFFSKKMYDEAFAEYAKSTELDPTYFDAWYQCGLCKYRQGQELNAKVSTISNRTKALETKEQARSLFGDAIPYFEKARDCKPDEPDRWAYELRQCYDATEQKEKAEEMDKLL